MAVLKSFDGTLPELPGEVIQHILSLLPIKDGGRASCLSKTWFNAWQTRSILCFDEKFCFLNPRNSQREGFLNYGNLALQRYREQNIGIEKFKLRFRTPVVNEWIQVALKNDVKKLKLVACSITDLVLPGIIFEAKSLLKLTVEGEGYYTMPRLKLPESMIQCPHIKSIHLSYLHLDNSDLQRIISSCPMVEDLIIWDCDDFGSFKVTNLSKLKKFKFRWKYVFDRTVEVEAPNLELLYCSRFPQLSMSAYQNLKQLQLFEVRITDTFFLDFEYRFPCLEDLTISNCQNLERIRMSLASLRKMELDILHSGKCLEELEINAPSMTSFKYTAAKLINKVSFTSDLSHCFSQVDLRRPRVEGTLFFVNLKKFLKNFSQSTIYLRLGPCFNIRHDDINIFDENKAMQLDSSESVQVHQLIIPALIPEKVLDAVCWSCHPKTISRIYLPPDEQFLQNIQQRISNPQLY